jgi:dethiobiotin synthetase
VILVVGMKLGCLNHARLSERAHPRRRPATGRLDRQPVDPRLDSRRIRRAGARSMASPCLGMLPHADARAPSRFAAHLRLPEGLIRYFRTAAQLNRLV